MTCEWILIANAGRARLLQREDGSHMTVLRAFQHDQGKEDLHFARELGAHLERAARQRIFDSLCIFASSPCLGELKRELGSATQHLLSAACDIDLTSVGPAELERRIDYELAQVH